MRTALLAAALALAAPAAGAPPDPCAAARAPLGTATLAALGEGAAEVEAYRAAWRRACDPGGETADVAALLGDAEALVSDVRLRRLAAEVVRTLAPGAAWPLPAVRRAEDGVAVDRDAFAAVLDRGTAEDARFFRALSRTLDRDGEPVWLGPAGAGGARCVRLVETSWTDVADALADMERAGEGAFAVRQRLVRERLLETLQGIAGGGPVCGCVRGDPLPSLDALAARDRAGPASRRALAAAAREAAQALRGKARVEWLRAAPEAPATGCAGSKM